MHVPLEPTRRFDSAAELAEFVRTQREPLMRVGCDLPHIGEWLLTRIRGADVLICVQQGRLRPAAVEISPEGPVFVGANSAVYAVDAGRQRVVLDTGTSFYEFVAVSASGATAVFEAAVAHVSPDGEVVWRRDVDLIGNYRREGGRLHIEFFDGGGATLDLSTGDLIV